jgi:hypothetical protein
MAPLCKNNPRRAGTTAAATLATVALVLLVVQLLAPDWAVEARDAVSGLGEYR